MCVSTMLVHVHGHLHLETPSIEPYMVTTLPFKNHVIETLTPTYKRLCALAKQISPICVNALLVLAHCLPSLPITQDKPLH